VFHARRVERGAPAALIVLGQLEVEALTVHPHRDSADTIPGIQVTPKGPECTVIGRHREGGESDSRTKELAALVEHGLFDYLVSLY